MEKDERKIWYIPYTLNYLNVGNGDVKFGILEPLAYHPPVPVRTHRAGVLIGPHRTAYDEFQGYIQAREVRREDDVLTVEIITYNIVTDRFETKEFNIKRKDALTPNELKRLFLKTAVDSIQPVRELVPA